VRTIVQSWLQVSSVQTTTVVALEPVQEQTAAVMIPLEPPRYGYVKCNTDACVLDETMQAHL
jgi:hypothetical protein